MIGREKGRGSKVGPPKKTKRRRTQLTSNSQDCWNDSIRNETTCESESEVHLKVNFRRVTDKREAKDWRRFWEQVRWDKTDLDREEGEDKESIRQRIAHTTLHCRRPPNLSLARVIRNRIISILTRLDRRHQTTAVLLLMKASSRLGEALRDKAKGLIDYVQGPIGKNGSKNRRAWA